jgi:hypothetical protein
MKVKVSTAKVVVMNAAKMNGLRCLECREKIEDGNIAVLVESRDDSGGTLVGYHDAHAPDSVKRRLDKGGD